ncbi:MAG: hypothetical protein R3D85_15490 [Paracoccaceae bacterium]
MHETATTTEMKAHYDCAHALRAATFRAMGQWFAGLVRKTKGPRQAARPLSACAVC